MAKATSSRARSKTKHTGSRRSAAGRSAYLAGKAGRHPWSPVVGRYDAAQTTEENRRHWANADSLSADAAATPSVRRIIRNRARYEVANNSIAKGIVLTLANDTIGPGPRLQVLVDTKEISSKIEKEFARWAKAIALAEKLRTMLVAKVVDGEAFGLLGTNDRLQTAVKLDLKLIEADRVTTPDLSILARDSTGRQIDGIRFDRDGNPTEYHILREHPGSTAAIANSNEYDRVPAENVIHYFRADRAEQHRGLPEIMPALNLFALLRRWTLATLQAAETAANIAVVMKTNAPAGGEAAEVDPWVTMELVRNTIMFAPEGWEPQTLKSENPSEIFEPFYKLIVNEIARCLNMPRNIALCNSSDYNYASGRLDHQTYFKSIEVERSVIERVILDRVLQAFCDEVVLVSDLLPVQARQYLRNLPHQWFWPGREHVDPRKEATAQFMRLQAGTTTLAAEYARQGLDWEEQLTQRAREIQYCRSNGIPLPGEVTAGAMPMEADDNDL